MSKLLGTTDIKREKGKLYFLKTNDKGLLDVYEAVMAHGGKSKKKK